MNEIINRIKNFVNELNKFDAIVCNGILANNEFGIKSITSLKSIKTLYFEREKYLAIKKLIRNRDIEEIITFQDSDSSGSHYLEIMEFKDQDRKSYIVAVYDSNELWQDPQIIEIFPLH